MKAFMKILLLPPNLVGHLRLLLLLAAVAAGPAAAGAYSPGWSLLLFTVSLALDAVDGYLARRWNQATAFGAWYDVAIDITSRALLWTWGASSPWAVVPVLLECFTFAWMHKEGGAAWKTNCFTNAPPVVRAVMRNGFRTPLGAFTVGGLMGCPLWLWARRHAVFRSLVEGAGPLGTPTTEAFALGGRAEAVHMVVCWQGWGWVVVPGRLLAAYVELWICFCHMRELLRQDRAAHAKNG